MMSQPDRGALARWSRVSLRAKGVATLSVPLAALFAALFSIYWMESDARDAGQMVVNAYDTRAELQQLHISLLDAETAVGGYLATGQGAFLSSHDSVRGSIEESLARLSALAGGDPASVATLEEIKRSAGEVLRIFGELLANTGARPGPDAASRAPLLERVKSLVGDVGQRLSLMAQAQDLRLSRARYNRDVARQRLFRIVIVCGIFGLLGALFVHLIITGRLVRRLQGVGENARRLAHGLPLDPFPPGTDEIADLARQLEDTAGLLQEHERELRESERRYRDLFDQAPIPYEETDREGVVRRFNQAVCGLLKCPPDQILGRRAWEFMAPDQQQSFRASLMGRISSGSEAAPFECDYLLADGSSITVEIRENLIRNARGEVTGVCRSLLDVTERNLAAVAARKVEQYAMELRNKNEQLAHALDAARSATLAKSRFLASVSHELRTPLNGVIGFSELMYDGRLGPITGEHRECLGDILTSARHLLQLINDILDLSKVEAGKMEFRPEHSRIETLVSEVRDVIRPLADKKEIRLSTEVPAGLTALIDPSRFKQVLYNYLSNAVKFTARGGSVGVRIALEENACFRLDVEDTGIGIPTGEISQLFHEFQQLPNSRKADQGTGLGLALTRLIVEAQGGTVAVRSVPGRGSVFSAILPLHPVR